MKTFYIAGTLLIGLLLTQHSQGARLYGARAAGADGELYLLDPATGAAIQDIGPLNDASGQNYPVTGLAFHPVTGVLYGSTGNTNEVTRRKLITIDRFTGLVTEVGNFNIDTGTMTDIAFTPDGNTLYGVSSINGADLYTIDIITGAATFVGNAGSFGVSGGAIEVTADGTIYGIPNASRFGTYDPLTGAFTTLFDPPEPIGDGAFGAMAKDAQGRLYVMNIAAGDVKPTMLGIVDVLGQTVTGVGASVQQLDAIAFYIPEPATATLLLASLALAALQVRRKR